MFTQQLVMENSPQIILRQFKNQRKESVFVPYEKLVNSKEGDTFSFPSTDSADSNRIQYIQWIKVLYNTHKEAVLLLQSRTRLQKEGEEEYSFRYEDETLIHVIFIPYPKAQQSHYIP